MGWSEKKTNEIFDGEFFMIASQQNDIINVRCVSCGNDAPLLRSSCKSNGNILKHIQVSTEGGHLSRMKLKICVLILAPASRIAGHNSTEEEY